MYRISAKYTSTVLVGYLLATRVIHAQVQIEPGQTVSENFDSMGTSATAQLPANWKADKSGSPRTLGNYAGAIGNTTLAAGNGMTSSSGQGIYNFGAGISGSASDRAIGFLASGSGTASGNLYVQLINSSDTETIAGITVSYDIEKYRGGINSDFRFQLYTSPDGANWSVAPGAFLTSFSADASNSGYTPAPGVIKSISDQILVTVAPNENIYLLWNYTAGSGVSAINAPALGVDNVVISAFAVPEPDAVLSLLSGMSILVLFGRLRR